MLYVGSAPAARVRELINTHRRPGRRRGADSAACGFHGSLSGQTNSGPSWAALVACDKVPVTTRVGSPDCESPGIESGDRQQAKYEVGEAIKRSAMSMSSGVCDLQFAHGDVGEGRLHNRLIPWDFSAPVVRERGAER